MTSRLTITAVRHTAKLNTDLLENILTMAGVTWSLGCDTLTTTDHYYTQLSRSGDCDTELVVSMILISDPGFLAFYILIVNMMSVIQ